MKQVHSIHKKFGERLQTLRKERGLTQEELAFKVGVDRSYLGFVERGERNPTLIILYRIAKALKISLAELFRTV